MNNENALSFRNVNYSHEKGKALHNANFDIAYGKTTVILGPNGAGKSILLKLCHGLLAPTSGEIIQNQRDHKSAMVFPKPVFLRRSVLQNLIFILEQMKCPKEKQNDLAHTALKEFSMDGFSNQAARLLSSGEKQRLSLIRALVLNPDILYLDEPTANLDPKATAQVEGMISNNNKNNMTIVMATHDLMQAKRIAEKIIFIENGHIIETSDADDFFQSPKSESAKNFISGEL